MSLPEIIMGVVLLFCGISIVFLIVLQESKGNGLSGAIGGDTAMLTEGRSRSNDLLIVKYTKYLAIAFFVLIFGMAAVNLFA